MRKALNTKRDTSRSRTTAAKTSPKSPRGTRRRLPTAQSSTRPTSSPPKGPATGEASAHLEQNAGDEAKAGTSPDAATATRDEQGRFLKGCPPGPGRPAKIDRGQIDREILDANTLADATAGLCELAHYLNHARKQTANGGLYKIIAGRVDPALRDLWGASLEELLAAVKNPPAENQRQVAAQPIVNFAQLLDSIHDTDTAQLRAVAYWVLMAIMHRESCDLVAGKEGCPPEPRDCNMPALAMAAEECRPRIAVDKTSDDAQQ